VGQGRQLVRLTPKAFAVLRYLVERPGQLVTKDELLAAVWAGTVVSEAAVTKCVRELRQALHDDAQAPLCTPTKKSDRARTHSAQRGGIFPRRAGGRALPREPHGPRRVNLQSDGRSYEGTVSQKHGRCAAFLLCQCDLPHNDW
jgi:hypothetical protein